MSIAIGRRRDLLTFQTATSTSDGQGNVLSWSTLGTAYGCVEALSGSEARQAEQLTGVLTTGITIPYRTDLSVKDRIVFGSRTLEIQAIQDMTGRHEDLRLMVVEVQA